MAGWPSTPIVLPLVTTWRSYVSICPSFVPLNLIGMLFAKFPAVSFKLSWARWNFNARKTRSIGDLVLTRMYVVFHFLLLPNFSPSSRKRLGPLKCRQNEELFIFLSSSSVISTYSHDNTSKQQRHRHRRTNDTNEVRANPPPFSLRMTSSWSRSNSFAGINVHLASSTRLLASAERDRRSC